MIARRADNPVRNQIGGLHEAESVRIIRADVAGAELDTAVGQRKGAGGLVDRAEPQVDAQRFARRGAERELGQARCAARVARGARHVPGEAQHAVVSAERGAEGLCGTAL